MKSNYFLEYLMTLHKNLEKNGLIIDTNNYRYKELGIRPNYGSYVFRKFEYDYEDFENKPIITDYNDNECKDLVVYL